MTCFILKRSKTTYTIVKAFLDFNFKGFSEMKKSVSQLVASLLFFVAASAAQAQTVADATVQVTGDFIGVCSLTTGNSLTLGTVDLPTRIVQAGTNFVHARIPISLGITCNSATLSWKMYNAVATGTALTIGSSATNKACISVPKTITSSGSNPNCATPIQQQNQEPVSGVGTAVVNADLVIWDSLTYGSIAAVPFRGNGSITATIPMKIEF